MDTPTDDERRPVAPEPAAGRPPADPEAPEADALDQAAEAVPGERRDVEVSVPFEASEADVLDQAAELPDDDDGF